MVLMIRDVGIANLQTGAAPDDERKGEGEHDTSCGPSNLDDEGLTLQTNEIHQYVRNGCTFKPRAHCVISRISEPEPLETSNFEVVLKGKVCAGVRSRERDPTVSAAVFNLEKVTLFLVNVHL